MIKAGWRSGKRSFHSDAEELDGGPSGFALPHCFCEGIPVLNSLDCRLRAAECEKLAEGAPNPRVQAILKDMARTWTRLALEAEQTLKQSRPSLQLIDPDPPRPPA
jgi:hypothetical protein